MARRGLSTRTSMPVGLAPKAGVPTARTPRSEPRTLSPVPGDHGELGRGSAHRMGSGSASPGRKVTEVERRSGRRGFPRLSGRAWSRSRALPGDPGRSGPTATSTGPRGALAPDRDRGHLCHPQGNALGCGIRPDVARAARSARVPRRRHRHRPGSGPRRGPEVDRQRAAGRRLGALARLPLLVKDNLDPVGFATTARTPGLLRNHSKRNAPCSRGCSTPAPSCSPRPICTSWPSASPATTPTSERSTDPV
jgi:hypothetical protein